MKFNRFVDSRENREIIANNRDFLKREHILSVTRISLIFITIFLIAIILMVQLIHSILYAPDAYEPPIDKVVLSLTLITFCALSVGLIAIYLIRQLKDTLHITEFQSMLFAGCMQLESDFCLIVHKEGRGVYCDYNFSRLMALSPVFSKDPYVQLLASEGISKADVKKIEKALASKGVAEVVLNHKSSNAKGAKTQKVTISIEPIHRPDGFFLFKGHKAK
ncbi:MAG: hypothetical protein EB060_03675 [Proteobacteria bacterium]|nr:hypothetical protein [Pseudomonadota bacterium]